MINRKMIFSQKTENIQYNAAIAITGAISGTSNIKLYSESGLESLIFRCWFRRIITPFYKLKTSGIPHYLLILIPHDSHSYSRCSTETITTYYCRTEVFKCSFFQFIQ